MKKGVKMDVNFTGLSNIYGIKLKHKKMNEAKEIVGDVEKTYLAMMLKNDEKGQDLTEFYNALATTDQPNRLHPIFDEFVTFASTKEEIVDDMGIKRTGYNLFVNSNTPLEVNDKNLKFFTYMAKLMKKVQNIPEKDFVASNGFMHNGVINKTLVLEEELPFDLRQFVPNIFFPTNVKAQAKDINANLQACMEDYFA